MSRIEIVREFGGAARTFALPGKWLEALEVAVDAGPLQIIERLLSNAWRRRDVVETLRLGLVGGGMKEYSARTLQQRHAGEDEPAGQFVGLAAEIITAAVYGAPVTADGDEPAPVVEAASRPPEPGKAAA